MSQVLLVGRSSDNDSNAKQRVRLLAFAKTLPVLRSLQEGPMSVPGIASATGLERSPNLWNGVAKLIASGLVERVSRGQVRLTSAGRRSIEAFDMLVE